VPELLSSFLPILILCKKKKTVRYGSNECDRLQFAKKHVAVKGLSEKYDILF
jgi:hypothetical protein